MLLKVKLIKLKIKNYVNFFHVCQNKKKDIAEIPKKLFVGRKICLQTCPKYHFFQKVTEKNMESNTTN